MKGTPLGREGPSRIGRLKSRCWDERGPYPRGRVADHPGGQNFGPHLARPGSPTRIDRFDPTGARTGYAIIEGHRIEFLDARSNRTGNGRIWHGEIQTFDRSGSRMSLGQ